MLLPKLRNQRFTPACILCLLVSTIAIHTAPVVAQELSVLGGLLKSPNNHSYAWMLDYQEGLGPYATLGLAWYNEGHPTGHHRDGPALQLWGRLPLANQRLVLAAGVGPYRYFDTVTSADRDGHINKHDWGALLSIRATYYTSRRWLMQLQLNRSQVFSGPNSTSLLFGIGYQLDAPDTPGPRDYPATRTNHVTHNEITVLMGQTTLNSQKSQTAFGGSIEYRRGIARYVDWTAGWLYEGSSSAIRRNGITSQLWLTRAFFNDTFTVAAGAGVYYAITHRMLAEQSESDGGRFSGIVSLSASYRLNDRWLTRLTWSRAKTFYNQDTDVIQAGLGYRF